MDYIIFKIYNYFKSKDKGIDNSINFLSLFITSLLYLLFFIINGLTQFYVTPEHTNPRMKYYIGIPLGLILLKLSRFIISKKINNDGYKKLEEKFKGKEKLIPIWVIFITPVIIIFSTPIIYGLINGTLRFPIFE